MIRDLRAALGLMLLAIAGQAGAADVQAGKAVADARCLQCHDADDWSGEDAAALESLIADIVARKVKHKLPLALSPAEISNIAAYWADSSR
jgi:mono/diheme cytochrome c family protein